LDLTLEKNMTVTKKKASESPKTKETKEVPDYFGHRQRLKARFVADMGKTMADYELLELILIYAIPRKDVKPLAKALLRRYSNLASVLAAPLDNLLKNEGVGESVAILCGIIHACANKISWENLENKDAPILSNKKLIVDYCCSCIGYSGQEHLLIIYLNKHGKYIAQNIEQVGTIDAVMISPREIVSKALNHNAAAIILAHNHPSGNATPSNADIEMTKQVVRALKAIGVRVDDHLIVTPGSYYSMQEKVPFIF